MALKEDLLFDLIESEAWLNVFFDRPKGGIKAERAALILTGSPLGHFPKQKGDKLTLWFGPIIERWTFKTEKPAMIKIMEILDALPLTIEPRFEGPGVKRFQKVRAREIGGQDMTKMEPLDERSREDLRFQIAEGTEKEVQEAIEELMRR